MILREQERDEICIVAGLCRKMDLTISPGYRFCPGIRECRGIERPAVELVRDRAARGSLNLVVVMEIVGDSRFGSTLVLGVDNH
ncbi:unnamed protein product [Allacma fusca]|uniref:Uncharacterized protein n=1 Tax=Allacma fusca TaxID=39272 RepID=A0A8J2JNQ4_9HEXA|nr:unnamed protein product [Allacma fusca]